MLKDVNNVPNTILNSGESEYQKRCAVELAQQVLNARLNLLNEDKNISDLFLVYSKILENEVSKKCVDSLKNTQKSLNDPLIQKLEVVKLKPNTPDSFLIIPIITKNHMFAGLIRKLDDNYSLTVINKGERSSNPMYKEYLVKEENLIKIIGNASKVDKSISDKYSEFEKSSSKNNFALGLKSREQKLGNCFIKEPETAIKFAVFTSSFSNEELKSIRNTKELITPKWPVETQEIHKRFIDELKNIYPEAELEISKEYDVYSFNKKLRELIKEGLSPKMIFKSMIPDKNTCEEFSSDEIKTFLKNINEDTMHQYPKDVEEIVSCIDDRAYIKKYKDLELISIIGNIYVSSPGIIDFVSSVLSCIAKTKSVRDRVFDMEELSKNDFPEAIDSMKHNYHAGFLRKFGILNMIFRPNSTLNSLSDAIKLYPENHKVFVVRGLVYLLQGKKDLAYNDINTAIKLKPDFKEAHEMLKVLEELKKDDKDLKDKNIFISKLEDSLNKVSNNKNKISFELN